MNLIAVIMRIMRAVNYAHHYHSMFEIKVYYYTVLRIITLLV